MFLSWQATKKQFVLGCLRHRVERTNGRKRNLKQNTKLYLQTEKKTEKNKKGNLNQIQHAFDADAEHVQTIVLKNCKVNNVKKEKEKLCEVNNESIWIIRFTWMTGAVTLAIKSTLPSGSTYWLIDIRYRFRFQIRFQFRIQIQTNAFFKYVSLFYITKPLNARPPRVSLSQTIKRLFNQSKRNEFDFSVFIPDIETPIDIQTNRSLIVIVNYLTINNKNEKNRVIETCPRIVKSAFNHAWLILK